jgi:hypothetical protein
MKAKYLINEPRGRLEGVEAGKAGLAERAMGAVGEDVTGGIGVRSYV